MCLLLKDKEVSGKYGMHAMASQNVRLPAINPARNRAIHPMKILNVFKHAAAGKIQNITLYQSKMTYKPTDLSVQRVHMKLIACVVCNCKDLQ